LYDAYSVAFHLASEPLDTFELDTREHSRPLVHEHIAPYTRLPNETVLGRVGRCNDGEYETLILDGVGVVSSFGITSV